MIGEGSSIRVSLRRGIGELIGAVVPTNLPNASNDPIHHSLFDEGWAMLRSLTSDLILCGNRVVTCLDARFQDADFDIDSLARSNALHVALCHSPENWFANWLELARDVDCVIVIAPEINGLLPTIVRKLREHGVNVLASDDAFLRTASDKLLFAEAMQKANLLHPATWSLKAVLRAGFPELDEYKGAFTLKRRDGAGCFEMRSFENVNSLRSWLNSEANSFSLPEDWIIQPWMRGDAYSLAFISGESSQVLGAFSQEISLVRTTKESGIATVQYSGGKGPATHLPMEHLARFANKVALAMPGTGAGWIGVDFLVPAGARNEAEWVAIEVNPRLTTSYAGYRAWYGHAIGDMILGIRAVQYPKLEADSPSIEFH